MPAMALRVIGSGLGRTGTNSLKLALEQLLGAPCYHMLEVFPRPEHLGVWTAAGRGQPVDWDALFAGFVAAVDWPAGAFWELLAAKYPDAIILHSERSDAETWFKSASATIFAPRPEPAPPPVRDMMDAVIGAHFTRDRENKAAAIAAYERHNAHVRATAPKDRLVLWKPGDGWEPICKALGVPVPATRFPHVNTTEEFRARIVERAAVMRGGGAPPH
jgi:hypothetical protein